MKILLVDDEPDFLEQAKLFLEKEGESFNVKISTSGEEALKILDNGDFEAVVSDYQMPEMNGLEFLETVREKRNSDIPFIIFTGKGREEVAIEALNLGADRYLQKGTDVKSQYGILADAITQEVERKRYWNQLQETRKKFQLLFGAIPDPAYFLNRELKFKEVNEAFIEVTGYDKDEVVGSTVEDVSFLPEDSAEKILNKWERRLEGEDIPPFEVQVLTKGGETLLVEINNSPILEKGDIAGVVGIARDVTKRKETQNKLEKSEQKFRRSFEASPDPTFLLDEEGKFIDFNEVALQRLGFEKHEIVDSTLQDAPFFPQETIEKTTEKFEKRKKGEKIPPYEVELRTKDGEKIFVEVNVGKFESNGVFEGEVVIARDITERMKKEKELRESEKRFSKLFENLNIAIIILNSEGEVISANPKVENLFGMDQEEIIEKDPEFWKDRLYNEDEEQIDISDFPGIRVIDSKEPIEDFVLGVYMPGEDEIIWGLVSATPQFDEEGEIERVIVSAKEITELQKTREWFEKVRKRYEKLFKEANEVVVTTGPEGYVKRLNKKCQEITGFTQEEAKGNSVLWIAHPDDREDYINFWKRIMDGEEVTKTLRFLDKSGDIHWIKTGGSPIRDDEGEIVEVQYTGQDITKRRRMEDRQEFLHSLLRHDVRNKATITQGYLEFLKDEDLTEEQLDLLEKALDSTSQEVRIIEKIRKLRKVEEEEEVEEVDLKPLVERTIEENMVPLREEGFQIDSDIPESKVMGGELLEELFSNLIGNSIQHSKGSRIKISGQSFDDEVQITVEDDGKGIPRTDRDKIFERGYKKGVTAGSGLGLSLVDSIIESYGGSIKVKDSELGGARFDVSLNKA